MNYKPFIIFLTLIVLIVFICKALLWRQRQQPHSIIFKRFKDNINIINNSVRLLCICHSNVPIPLLRTFTTGCYSHWSLGVIDDKNNFYTISTLGNNSVVIHLVDLKALTVLPNGDFSFDDPCRWQHVIPKNEIFKPNKRVNVLRIIQLCYEDNQIPYELFGKNCQYQVLTLLNKITDHKFNIKVDTVELIKKVINEFFNGFHYTGRKSKIN